MAIYSTHSTSSSNSDFHKRMSKIRDILHPETISKYRRTDEENIKVAQKAERIRDYNSSSKRSQPYTPEKHEKSDSYYDEETFKRLLRNKK